MATAKRKILYGFVILSACCAVSILMAVDRPPIFALNQAANHFSKNGEGSAKQVAIWLIDSGIADDWSIPEDDREFATQYPLLRTAANSDNIYPYQTYLSNGQPRGLTTGPFLPPAHTQTVSVSSAAEIASAIRNAQPGDIISIAAGIYDIKARSISVKSSGTADLPIYVRAEKFGSVLLKMDTLEGFHVLAPFWVFENLRIQGMCKSDSHCDHAFHVVGQGKFFTLRNSEIFNFNAHVKVNLQPINGTHTYADYGLIEYSSFFNEWPRSTGNSVTLLNIDSADGWVVRGNHIADFSKNGSDRISYGAFMKGNGHSGIFERNLVICEHRIPADQGIRLGLSFGGGGMQYALCKNQSCDIEHYGGIIRNNIIMNCSRDVGIYLNKSAKSQIHHNLLFNTLGIDVRFDTSSANITGNIISGRIKNRNGGQSRTQDNIITKNCVGAQRRNCELDEIYQSPDQGDFRLKNLDNRIWTLAIPAPKINVDFCGRPLPKDVNPGPLQYYNGLDCLIPSS